MSMVSGRAAQTQPQCIAARECTPACYPCPLGKNANLNKNLSFISIGINYSATENEKVSYISERREVREA